MGKNKFVIFNVYVFPWGVVFNHIKQFFYFLHFIPASYMSDNPISDNEVTKQAQRNTLREGNICCLDITY